MRGSVYPALSSTLCLIIKSACENKHSTNDKIKERKKRKESKKRREKKIGVICREKCRIEKMESTVSPTMAVVVIRCHK